MHKDIPVLNSYDLPLPKNTIDNIKFIIISEINKLENEFKLI